MGLSVLMIALLAIIIRPIAPIVRVVRSLTESLQLANTPGIKQRMFDYTFQQNVKKATTLRQWLSSVYPYVTVVMVLSTGMTWTMLDLATDIDQGYLFMFSLMASAYTYLAFTFKERPTWLLVWTSNMEMIRRTLELEEVNKEIDRIKQSILEIGEPDDPRVTAAIAVLEKQLDTLVLLGSEHVDKLSTHEPDTNAADVSVRDDLN